MGLMWGGHGAYAWGGRGAYVGRSWGLCGTAMGPIFCCVVLHTGMLKTSLASPQMIASDVTSSSAL